MKIFKLENIDRLNEKVGKSVSILILGIIGIIIIEVIARYFFNSPTIWVSETSEFLFAYCFLLSAAYTLAVGGHVGSDIVILRLSGKIRTLIELIRFPFFLLFTGTLLWKGFEMAWDSVSCLERSQSPWRPYIFHVIAVVPIAALLLLLQGISKFIRDIKSLKREKK